MAGTIHGYPRRDHMDAAARRNAGDPFGNGVTEADCRVIFNQRMKPSGMRWSRRRGHYVVDLRTACRSRLWDKIWSRGPADDMKLAKASPAESQSGTPELSEAA